MRRFIALLLVVSGTTMIAAPPPATPDVIGLIDAYLTGRYDQAVSDAAAADDLGPFRLRFVQDTPGWITADPALAAKRRAATAAFLLELMHARLESDYYRFSDLVEWTCVQLRASGAATPFERSWYLASVALASRARARIWLLGESPRLPHQPPLKRTLPPKTENPSPRHLMHAIERVPDEPRLQLAQIVAWTWGRDAEPIRNRRAREDDSSRFIRRPTQLDALTAYEKWLDDPIVGAEARVRSGLIHFSVGAFENALRAFEPAQEASDAQTRYLALFNAGRALEALQRQDEAVVRYEKALTAVPSAESATIALASLRFSRDEREAAVALLTRRFSAAAREHDPMRLVGYGSFSRWDDLRADLRREVAR
jgi:tetratricopeptide (TPR) repeat protein